MKKPIVFLLIALIGVMAFTGCAEKEAKGAAPAEAGAEAAAEEPELMFAMVGYAMGSTFHTTLWQGASDACDDLGIKWTVNAPQVFDLQKQVGMMEAALDSGADAIIYSAIVENGYNDFVKKAHDKGVLPNEKSLNSISLSSDETVKSSL